MTHSLQITVSHTCIFSWSTRAQAASNVNFGSFWRPVAREELVYYRLERPEFMMDGGFSLFCGLNFDAFYFSYAIGPPASDNIRRAFLIHGIDPKRTPQHMTSHRMLSCTGTFFRPSLVSKSYERWTATTGPRKARKIT